MGDPAGPRALVTPSAYEVGGTAAEQWTDVITVQRARQRDGSFMWAVRRNGNCLNRDGKWEWEPMPSSRDEDFMYRCRWTNPSEAINAAQAAATPAAPQGGGSPSGRT